jgi:hypothetical protein
MVNNVGAAGTRFTADAIAGPALSDSRLRALFRITPQKRASRSLRILD